MLQRIKIIIVILLTVVTSLFTVVTSPAQALAEPDLIQADQALCPPGFEDMGIQDCLIAGPSATLEELAVKGITYPEKPIIAGRTPIELAEIPFTYAIVSSEEIPTYASLEKVANKEPTGVIAAGKIKYVSLNDKAETPVGLYYQIATEQWISAEYIRKVAVQNFQGYVFKKNPDFIFGWVINESIGRSEPGYAAPETGHQYWRFDIVHIYDSKFVNEIEWVMVAPDEWIEKKNVARVIPNYTKPQGVTSDRWIEINLYEQVISVYENGNILFATLVSTGVDPFYTQPGVFQIYKKLEHDPMSGTFEADRSDYYYLEDVPFILYYDQLRALHGAYWHSLFGYPRSHGCVNLSVADAHWIFNWSNVGDFVYVLDPSGKTPTDPAFYGAGGV